MAKEICISSTPHETRLAILEDDQLAEIYYERENEYTLAGSVYKGRVTRVLPGMQSAFVDVGLERDAFLYVSDFLEEQEEDSAEFERVDASGNGGGRRQREPRESRDREPRQPAQQAEADAQPSEAAAPRRDQEGEQEGHGVRRWQGRRGRRIRGRGPRNDRTSSERPTTDVVLESPGYTAEAIADEPAALPERGAPGGVSAQALPIVLPGESLARYGGGATAESRPSAPAPALSSRPAPSPATSRPSTLVEVPTGWDGGAVLPGESLSRHRGQDPQRPATRQPATSAESTGAVESPEPSVEAESAWTHEPIESAEPSEPPEVEAPAPWDLAAAVPQVPTPVDAAVAQSQAEVAGEASEPETIEEVHEYEPDEASASHRVEPHRSEMRFGGPVEEEVIEEEEQDPPLSEPGTQAESAEVNAASSAESSSPEADVVRQLFGHEPGMGVLEEETIDEDEYDFEPILAESEEHAPEEMEEETLDRASTMEDTVRDVHIDRRLGYSTPAEAEEEPDETEVGFAETEEESGTEEEEDFDEPAAESNEEAAAGAETPAPNRREGRRFDRRGRGRQQGRRHGGRRPSMQTSDLPIISELLKQGQEILVQIAKEPIARKGARITSHIALPGRFLVFMPTVNHVGVSRKISSDEERQRLKRILVSEKAGAPGGFIVRTAAENASEDDLRADIRFLINLWNEMKQRADSAKAPALIYHDLNLIERILRDQVSDNFSTIWVDSESEYERIVRFLNRFQPSLVRRVKLYTKETPLFEQFGIQEEISKALKSKVWLKSGGSIVINQTEALVAIDINTGKYVGKTARLEDTILKTNLDAIPEIVRQIRLRDLGGIIVIDFIDMDERRNRQKVTQALEDALKVDRAPSKVLQFNDFGLVAITRKRVKQSLERTLSVPCPTCTGTGMVKSPITVANEIYIEMRKMLRHFERNDVLLRVHPEVVKVLTANNAKWLNELEELTGKTIIVKSDPTLPPEQFDIQG
jgi:Rne/Rng family ribonuclease